MSFLKTTGILIILFYLLSAVAPVNAQSDTTQAVSKRPSVGLVMSGGGAKGWAYIGVLRVLQEVGLEVDYIAGASAGSIVGGMYAIGYHPDSIEKIIRSQNWDAVMKDELERKYIAYDDKIYGGRYIFSLPFREKKIGLKAALYEGQNVDLLLNRYYSVVYKDTLFSQFQTPFVCIGTDLYDGKEVVLDRGYLPQAIRSSMAIQWISLWGQTFKAGREEPRNNSRTWPPCWTRSSGTTGRRKILRDLKQPTCTSILRCLTTCWILTTSIPSSRLVKG
ncbi:MAG: patatin-like phospholipase family protein [bacterium]